jgi:hypothetical protein
VPRLDRLVSIEILFNDDRSVTFIATQQDPI